MKTSIKNSSFAVGTFAIATFAFAALATCFMGNISHAQQNTTQQRFVQPLITPPVAPIAQQYYFGFSVQLTRLSCGTPALQIVSVTPNSPAHLAGLEVGDAIRTVNGQGFTYARDSFHGVNLLNQFVSGGGGGPAPAQAAQAYVYPSQPIASMVVRNVRNGQLVQVTVQPTRRGGIGVPVAAAQAQ